MLSLTTKSMHHSLNHCYYGWLHKRLDCWECPQMLGNYLPWDWKHNLYAIRLLTCSWKIESAFVTLTINHQPYLPPASYWGEFWHLLAAVCHRGVLVLPLLLYLFIMSAQSTNNNNQPLTNPRGTLTLFRKRVCIFEGNFAFRKRMGKCTTHLLGLASQQLNGTLQGNFNWLKINPCRTTITTMASSSSILL